MSWYRQGTIAVTNGSATITGAGTAWVENVRVGDGFQGPDGRLYEVTNVASNTSLSISPNYAGVTASGQAYWIIPVQGYTKRLADRAAGFINDYDDAKTLAQGALQKEQNLNDLTDKPAARTNLGLGTAATADVTTSPTDTTVGRVLKVGDFGFGGNITTPGNMPTPPPTQAENITQVYRVAGAADGVVAQAPTIHVASGNGWGRLRFATNSGTHGRAWIQSGHLTGYATNELWTSGNLRYESGTWTPTVFGTGDAGSYEFGTTYGHYQVVGKEVTLFAWITIDTITTMGSGLLSIGGLPITKRNNVAAVGSVRLQGVPLGSDVVDVVPEIRSIAQAYNQIYLKITNRDGTSTTVNAASLTAGSLITFSFSYLIN